MKPIILASTSPRRKELLANLGVKFTAVSSDYEEDMTLKLKPTALAKKLSAGKAEAVADKHPKHIIIAADTFVVLGDELLGKPHTAKEATRMLKRLSGKTHEVITGFTIIDTAAKKKISQTVTTKIFFKKLSEREIADYVKTKEPLDKAGAYGIQGMGSIMVKKIEGDFFNVMGLPVYELSQALKKFGVNIL